MNSKIGRTTFKKSKQQTSKDWWIYWLGVKVKLFTPVLPLLSTCLQTETLQNMHLVFMTFNLPGSVTFELFCKDKKKEKPVEL